MKRIGIYGWGVVAPRSPDVASFAANLASAESWLSPFDGFGPSNFLVGQPSFDFDAYRGWIDERFPPSKFSQLQQKMGAPVKYAIGAFIQALGQNPGIEQVLQDLGSDAQVLVGTGLGDLPTIHDASVELYLAQRRWDRFWAQPQRNADRLRYEDASTAEREVLREQWEISEDPARVEGDAEAREAVERAWNRFWASRSDGLRRFLDGWNDIESKGVQGEVASGKLHALRRKRAAIDGLMREWACPRPPWLAVSANVLWNIHNTSASQISMLGKITGAAYAPVGACSTFGLALHLAMQAIRCGTAKAVVVGATDPAPHPLSVGTFYDARVLAADRSPSVPLTELRGTHVAGGACAWIIGDHAFMAAQGFRPLGLELLSVGVTADADHIITPSEEGPQESIRRALADAGVGAHEIATWDLHATATPGDVQEVQNLQPFLRDHVVLTARKGTFGHGMAVGGGWELLAQHLGLQAGQLYPTPLTEATLNPGLARIPFRYVTDGPCPAPSGPAGKLSMGVGGINACIVSRPWDEDGEG